MIEKYSQVNRKIVGEDRIAICPQFGCKNMEKVKPLKFGILGFRKYPICSKHKLSLVFVDEFIENFLQAVNACLYDLSGLPPASLTTLIKKKAPYDLQAFINGWLDSNPLGRGAQIVSQYMDGLSKSYMKLISRKQKKSLKDKGNSKKRVGMLRLGLKTIAEEYSNFLRKLREYPELFHDSKELHIFSKDVRKILKTWLKTHLNEIQISKEKKRSEIMEQNQSLSMLKMEYDKILHAGTCTLLLGKSPTLVTKGISAFELFSTYFEFSKAGLCNELNKKDIEKILKGNEGEIYHFKQEIAVNLKNLNNLIEATKEQKELIWLKSVEILKEFILRAENKDLILPLNTKPRIIASTIIYTVALSNKNMPKISVRQISNLVNTSNSRISELYTKFFKRLYPRKEFLLTKYNLSSINKIFAAYFFELMSYKEVIISDLVVLLRENVLKNVNLPKQLTQKQLSQLHEIATQHQHEFNKYFSDLAEVVKQIIKYSLIHKTIGAYLVIKYLADHLEKKNINLFQKAKGFSLTITWIFDHLKEKYPNFFPYRVASFKENPERINNYRKVLGKKLKLYVIKNIYNGIYFNNGRGKCPECKREGLNLNTDIQRLDALDFHHSDGNKEKKYSASNLYSYFTHYQSNPNFLEDLIEKMETEKVILICRAHHFLLHDKYFGYFYYLINWKDLLSLPADLIHLIIYTAVNNFRLTKDLSTEKKAQIRIKILRKIKKKYILELFYGDLCHTCKEFSTRKHLPSFIFHHIDEELKTVNASDLFHLSCSKIIKILEKEKGGYICTNCHSVLHFKAKDQLNEIFGDEDIITKIFDDYIQVSKKFTLLDSKDLVVRNPLEKFDIINGNIEKYLTLIYNLTESGSITTSNDLKDHFKITRNAVMSVFKRNSILRKFVDILAGKPPKTPTKFILTEEGNKAASLIFHFRNHYIKL